jgi:glycine/sarcosine N-methyltransferase
MYDQFSQAYDHFVDWTSRLNYELPFIEATLKGRGTHTGESGRVLDAACGTGWHAIALAQKGWQVTGADFSPGMIKQARRNARQAKVDVRFIQAEFGVLADRLREIHGPDQPQTYDAVLCLGNSLPHLLEETAVRAALKDFAACLAPGGLLVLQNRNFDQVMRTLERWMEPQASRVAETEWLFLRFYDFLPDGLIDFHVLSLQREGAGPWRQRVHTTRLRPLLQSELSRALEEAGFEQTEFYGDMQGESFDLDHSGNLITVSGRKRD